MLATLTYCIVGCNTGAPDQQALHVLECNTETGAARIVQSVTGLQGTTYFALDAARKNLYTMISVPRPSAVSLRSAVAASAAATPSTNEKPTAALVKFALDGHTVGAMTKLCDLPCEAPCHIALSPDEKTLGFAAYLSGTCGAFNLEDAGTPPRLRTFVFPDDEVGPNAKRQKKAYAHQVFFLDPNGVGPANTMGVVDLGCDRIWFFDTRTMERRSELTIKADPGDGPRHTIVPPNAGNKILYTLNELASTVTAYTVPTVSSRSGADKPLTYTRLASYSTLPADFNRWEPDGETLATKAAAIKLTADGKILMASNRGHDSIAFYDVGPTGMLTLKNIAKLTGKFPRDFELMPGEKFMVVGHKMSNEIQVYAFDRAACTLTPTGAPIACWRPLCFKFL